MLLPFAPRFTSLARPSSVFYTHFRVFCLRMLNKQWCHCRCAVVLLCIIVTSTNTESSSADSQVILSALWQAKITVLACAQQESISVAGQLACSAWLAKLATPKPYWTKKRAEDSLCTVYLAACHTCESYSWTERFYCLLAQLASWYSRMRN